MPTPFKPFLIGNQRTGLELNLNPWLLPGDAYQTLDNFYMYQGRVTKRAGKTLLATSTNKLYDPQDGTFVTDASDGSFVIDPSVGTAYPIVGLYPYTDSSYNLNLMMCTTKRLFQFLAGSMVDVSLSDTFAGGTSDFFHFESWLNTLYMCNGVDQLFAWNGTSISGVTIDPGSAGYNTVTGMIFVAAYKDRLVILSPVESSTRYPRRARWCAIGDATTWAQANYLDAPTSDVMTGAAFLGDELYVWFQNSIWILRYLGLTNQPFIWVRYSGDRGASARKSILSYNNQHTAVGVARMTGCDGSTAYYIDEKIPGLVLGINPQYLGLCYSALHETTSQIWMSYPSDSNTSSNKILVLNFDDKAWSTFSLPVNCFGRWPQRFNWSTGQIQAGYPQLLAGSVDGSVYIVDDGADDQGTPITASLETGQLNPFVKEGRQAFLGWVDFLVDTDSSSMQVSFSSDNQQTPYIGPLTVPLSDGRGRAKSLVRVPVNCNDDFHQISISHSTTGSLNIHAIVPYMKPTGRLNG